MGVDGADTDPFNDDAAGTGDLGVEVERGGRKLLSNSDVSLEGEEGEDEFMEGDDEVEGVEDVEGVGEGSVFGLVCPSKLMEDELSLHSFSERTNWGCEH